MSASSRAGQRRDVAGRRRQQRSDFARAQRGQRRVGQATARSRGDRPPSRPSRRCSGAPRRSRRRAPPRARSPIGPASAPIASRRTAGTPSNPISPRITSAMTAGESVAGAPGRSRCRPHGRSCPPAGRASARNGAKSVARQLGRAARRPRAATLWLSAPARPWPGMCLTTGSTPPSQQPVAHRAAERRHRLGSRRRRRGRR